MRNFFKAVALTTLSTLGVLALPAQAGVVLFQDNFDADLGTSSLNFNGFTNWDVDNGTVDYIRAPNGWSIDNCVGGCVDIDGSTGNGGRMTTKSVFNIVAAHIYKISVDVSGNQRTDTLESLMFGMSGGLISFNFNNITAGDIFSTYSGSFSGFAGIASLFMETASNDNVGAIIDNVKFECLTCDIASVPEPGVFGLLGLGLLGLGIARKRKTAVVA